MNESKSSEETLFEALCQLPALERAASLQEACGQDAALRERLEILLAAHDRASGFMAEPVAPAVPGNGGLRIPVPERLGDQIGPYKLIQQIGEGGCGVVYMAQQDKPVRRLVALKVIKLGMDTRQVVARFEAERQALALMDHPNIAKVLDAGATETGRPFFVMELVRGIKITDYCDQNQLATAHRLDLFIQVCQAVQHAHQKGVIHRDLKPSNILVTLSDGVPLPKVIDFGIAKATQGRLTDMTLVTAFEQFIGTPAYVSPEQALMTSLDIDTRSDIYSLGVLLYELLTGTTPFDTQQLLASGLDALRRTIREQQPLRPSTRLSTMWEGDLTTVAKARHIEPGRLTSLLRGDLDWIVMKCLEKDRAHRYDTAIGLARDIERHLNNEPVTARPPSRLYELQRTVRRHLVGFAAAGAVVATLAIGVVVSTLEVVRARTAEQEQTRLRIAEANQRAASQQLLYKFLLDQGRATRLARRLGYRDQVFALLKQARALDVPEKNLAELRREALACMEDFVGLTPATFTDFPSNPVPDKATISYACLAPSGRLAAFIVRCGAIRIQVREMPSGKELAQFEVTDANCQDLRFSSNSDELFAKFGPPGDQVITWAPDEGNRWRETQRRSLPPITTQLLSSGTSVFAINLKPPDEGFKFVLHREVIGREYDIEFIPPNDLRAEDPQVRFRLLDARTGSFLPGYDATNAIPRVGQMSFCASADGRVLAIETPASDPPHSTYSNGGVMVADPKESESPLFKTIVNLYDWRIGQRINQLSRTNDGPISGGSPLRLSDDGKYLISLSEAGGTVYSVPGLEPVMQLKGAFYGLPPLVSGTMVALPGIRLWNLALGKEIGLLDESEDAWPVGFSADGAALLSAGGRHARLYQLNTLEKLNLPPHAAAVPGVAFSPDGTRLASVGKDRVMRVCDALTGRTLWETNDLPGLGQCVRFSPDGRLLSIGVYDRDLVWIRDAQTGKRLLELGTGQAGKVFSAEFSGDGHYLATAGDFNSGIRIWSLQRGKASQTGGILDARLVKSWTPGQGFVNLLFAPEGRSVAFATLNYSASYLHRTLYLWDFDGAAEPRQLAAPIAGLAECGGFAPDGRQVVAMNVGGEILTLSPGTGRLLSSAHTDDPQLTGRAIEVQLSPDCSKLAAALKAPVGWEVRILDPGVGKLFYSLPAQAGEVMWLAWSPDSRRLAVSLDNGSIAIWNLEQVERTLGQIGLNP